MSKMAALKAQAKNLQMALVGQGISYTLAQAQVAIAQQYGMPNWDTLSGVASRTANPQRAPRLADLPGVPVAVRVEEGNKARDYDVGAFDTEVLDLLHLPEELEAFLAKHVETYPQGLDTVVVVLEGDARAVQLTARQLGEGRYVELGGRAYWEVPSISAFLGFEYEQQWKATAQAESLDQPELQVPAVTKSLKGVKLLVLPSCYGSAYDLQALVPAHLNVEAVKDKIRSELDKLAEKDRALGEGEESSEYSEEDVRGIVVAQGCMWLTKADYAELPGTWDATAM